MFKKNSYLIKNKNIEQIKEKVKEWFAKNEMEIVFENSSIIEGYKFDSFFRYPLRITVMLSENSSGVILSFTDDHILKPKFWSYEYIYKFIPLPIFLPRILSGEYSSNLVRFITGKMEIYINFLLLNFVYYFGLLIIFVFLDIFLHVNIMPFMGPLGTLSGLIVYILLIPLLILLIIKNISLNDKYYIEEYKGKIDID